MSAEWAETVLTADMRTAPDGRGVEYAVAHTQQPRWLKADGTINRDASEETWAACHLYAEDAVLVAARAVREQPMDGITGDHPDKREAAAALLEAAAGVIRVLALDHAGDGGLTDERWEDAVGRVKEMLT